MYMNSNRFPYPYLTPISDIRSGSDNFDSLDKTTFMHIKIMLL